MENHYTYRAEWSPEDNEYVGLVAEFPSLSWLAATPAEAVAGVAQLVDDILIDMKETGETPPTPLTERRYSGNISFRTSPDQHRRLTIEAAEQGVSVNQWMVQKLSAFHEREQLNRTQRAFDDLKAGVAVTIPGAALGLDRLIGPEGSSFEVALQKQNASHSNAARHEVTNRLMKGSIDFANTPVVIVAVSTDNFVEIGRLRDKEDPGTRIEEVPKMGRRQ
ncbi:type II toxin-antitoxin system HicB family antitoxin [Mycolicibacterium vaccae]|uniref:type II toxin-antitoxin system HicB family antitoxin n=1 Tax=Mycolicibacterium vaccae TaxID=1810 RepID=UPI003D05EDA8